MKNDSDNPESHRGKIRQLFKSPMQDDRHDEFKYEYNISRYLHDLLIVVIGTLIILLVARQMDLMETIHQFARKHEDWELDEFLAVSLFWTISLAIYAIRRAQELRKSQKILIDANTDLLGAMSEIKKLKGILPICASCKKIRDDKGYWQQVELYIRDHSDAEFSHGICPDCARELYPDINLDEPIR